MSRSQKLKRKRTKVGSLSCLSKRCFPLGAGSWADETQEPSLPHQYSNQLLHCRNHKGKEQEGIRVQLACFGP